MIALAALLLVSFFTWAIWVSVASANRISATVESYEVLSDQQTKVTFNVTSPAGGKVLCAIQVLNSGYEVVGYREIPITESQQTAVINTVSRGVTGVVEHCWVK